MLLSGGSGFTNIADGYSVPPVFKDILFLDWRAFGWPVPARTWASEKWGYIDELGRWVIVPTYLDAGLFIDGYAAAQIAPEAWEILDSNGNATGSIVAD